MTKVAQPSQLRSGPTQTQTQTNTDPSAIVILKESDLDCDLATAISRVRSQEATAKSRILVIAPEARSEVGTESTPTIPAGIPLSFGQAARRGELVALQPFGRRLLAMLTCLERFFEESRWAIDELEESVADEPRARLLNQVRVLKEIQHWTQEVADDLRTEAKGAAEGFRPLDTAEIWAEAIDQVQSLLPELRVTVSPSEDSTLCWVRAPELAEAFYLALLLTGNRIGSRGAITISAERAEPGWLTWAIRGHGEPGPIQAQDAIARLRRFIVEVHAGRITADSLGSDAAGLEIHLPLRT